MTKLLERVLKAAAPPDDGVVVSVDLGRITFEEAHQLQLDLQHRRRRELNGTRVGHLLLHVEHHPIFTVTRRARPEHILWDAAERTRRGVTLADVDRGGDVTFHGPGQVVGYPLLDLRQWRLGTSDYMHRLEDMLIRVLATLGISAHARPEMPGVWVTRPDAREAKIAALGVRVSRGLTRHGFSLNHTVDLDWFSGIVPCGLPLPVTSIAHEAPPAGVPTRAALLDQIDAAFAQQMDCTVVRAEI